MTKERGIFQRTELLLGREKMDTISQKKVIIFGIGGVGSWCAESLVRTGIKQLTIVDSDRVCITNINRQLHATTRTVGQVKSEVLKQRLLEINPYAQINAIQKIYNQANHDFFALDTYDYIIDCIDSLSNKIHLIRMATRTDATFFSSMGASLKVDPTRIQVGEFWKVDGCPLGSMLRKQIRKGELPAKKFMCVFSNEVLENKGEGNSCGTDKCLCPKNKQADGDPELANHEWCSSKAKINGTTAHITAIFGFTLAGLVIQDIYKEEKSTRTIKTSPLPSPGEEGDGSSVIFTILFIESLILQIRDSNLCGSLRVLCGSLCNFCYFPKKFKLISDWQHTLLRVKLYHLII